MTSFHFQPDTTLASDSGARGMPLTDRQQWQLCGRKYRAEITVTRWSSACPGPRREAVAAADEEYVLGVALMPTRIRLLRGRAMVFDGVMTSGMTYVCGPSQTLDAEFTGPADILHLHLAGPDIREQLDAGAHAGAGDPIATMLPRDSLVEQLAHAVASAPKGAHASYIEAMAQAIAMRTTQIDRTNTRVLPLPTWRLKQVIAYIEAHLADAISLNDLATTAGLSRTHFAAQFRLATGCKPHEFVLLQRIEAAKRMLLDPSFDLIDVALSAGFQAQAHFSTVFKRFVGETPGRWRRSKFDQGVSAPEGPPDGSQPVLSPPAQTASWGAPACV